MVITVAIRFRCDPEMPIRAPDFGYNPSIMPAVCQGKGDFGISEQMKLVHGTPRCDVIPFRSNGENRHSDIR